MQCWSLCACPLQGPVANLLGCSRTQPHTCSATINKIKVEEKTVLLLTCLQYSLSTLLAGRPNDTFPFRIQKWIILSVLRVMFTCLWKCDPYSLCYRHDPDAFLPFRYLQDTLNFSFLFFTTFLLSHLLPFVLPFSFFLSLFFFQGMCVCSHSQAKGACSFL